MNVLDRAQALSAAGRPGEAVRLVTDAAMAGDGEALFAVANWRLYGLNGPRDFAASRVLAGQAAAAGYPAALHLQATLLANGAGGARDPAAARRLLDTIDDAEGTEQRALLDAMPGSDAPARTVLSDDPPVATVPALLSPAECAYLIRKGASHLRPSAILDQAGRSQAHPFRTSAGMNFGPSLADPVVSALNARFAVTSGTAFAAGEPLQLLRYRPGEEYRPHLDAIPGAANQRDWTLLAMLHPPEAGGETRFDELDLTIRLGPGDALLFRNVDAAGRQDPRTRHAGLPVIRGEKWLATRWIRREPLADWNPPA